MQATPYLNFNGDCAAAFRFYAGVLGGRVEELTTHGDSPVRDQVLPDWHDSVLHARLVAGEVVLLGSDAPPAHYDRPQGLYVSLQLGDAAEAERIFHALAEHGTITMPLGKTFRAARFGMLVDRFNTPWMVSCAAGT